MDHLRKEIDISDLIKNTMVFAPHQDDESLGCGGAIKMIRDGGAHVSVTFMTNGAADDRAKYLYGDEDKIVNMRNLEAKNACRVLGVNDVNFLNYMDGNLYEFREQAEENVIELLYQQNPQQIFITYENDLHPDHETTAKIVKNAIRITRMNVDVYEYPVWIRSQWPFVSQKGFGFRVIFGKLHNLNKIYREFDIKLDISDVVEVKKEAIDSYFSQTVKLDINEEMQGLFEIFGGEWIKSFFNNKEIYKFGRYKNGVYET